MDTHSEPAADIGNLSIAIDGGKQTEAVYYQAIRLTDILFVGTGITHIRTLQLTDYLYQMIFVDYMRSYNQLYFRMLIKIFDKQILVGLPGTSGNKSHRIVLEQLNQRQVFSLFPNLKHAVKTGIPHHSHPVDTNLRQITLGALVLHEDVVEVAQHVPIRTAVPFKENLPAAKDGRHAINGDAALMQLIQIVLPKLILDKKRHAGIHQVKKLPHIARFVERQITHDIRPPVVLAHFITRRRKECQQNTIIRIFGTYLLNQRASLFKLSQRGSVKPDITRILLQLLPKKFVHYPVPLHHLPRFTAERSHQVHRNIIEYYC